MTGVLHNTLFSAFHDSLDLGTRSNSGCDGRYAKGGPRASQTSPSDFLRERSMEMASCSKSHKCADGGIGECSQAKGHFGRHLCRSCMAFFGGGEIIDPGPIDQNEAAGRSHDERGITGSENAPAVTPMDLCPECFARTASILCPYCWRYVCAECSRWYPCSRAQSCGHCGKVIKMGEYSNCGKCDKRIHLNCYKCPSDAD
jgi:hypothetical protein